MKFNQQSIKTSNHTHIFQSDKVAIFKIQIIDHSIRQHKTLAKLEWYLVPSFNHSTSILHKLINRLEVY